MAAGWMVAHAGNSPRAGADDFDEVRRFIRDGLVERSVPSLAVAVAKDGKILWEEGFGWADREQRRLANPHTVYSLASISKPITTTGLMTLVQAGKVQLDRPINDYLGAAKLRARVGDAKDATVRRVTEHTSGLPMHWQYFYADEPYRRPSADDSILRYGNLITAPGEAYEYSNIGYGVLDYVIERVSGRSYADFMRDAVFLPLGMTRSSVDLAPGLETNAATRYDAAGAPLPHYDSDSRGGSNVWASAHDLVTFGMFHLHTPLPAQQRILSDASIETMHRRTAGTDAHGYGIGFEVGDRNGERLIGHSGSMGGVRTQMMLFPERKLAIVVLSNSNDDLVGETAERIAAKLLPKWPIPPPRTWPEPPPFVTPDELLGTWRGTLVTYNQDLPVELSFLPSGEVHAQVGGQLRTLVNSAHFENNKFTGELGARIGTADTERYDYTVRLSLQLRGTVLNGGATARDVETQRMRNALTHWLELTKE
ncbi:MAG: beta-lactamase family protein [Steroidobacter sp.]|nr:beta-lactamase family protein [Steroidobacter sp.]